MSMPTIALVACVKRKREVAAPARDLYTSPWFVLARAWAEANAERWYILSARWGLVSPEQRLYPYEATMKQLSRNERLRWAEHVCQQFDSYEREPAAITVLAGNAYRDFLVPLLGTSGHTIALPMAGLGIGEQLAWLKEHTENPVPAGES